MITVFMDNQGMDNQMIDQLQPMHPLTPVDAAGHPVNLSAFHPGRESEPLTMPAAVMQPAEHAPVLHEEVAKAGVAVTPVAQAPHISEEQQAIGVMPTTPEAVVPAKVTEKELSPTYLSLTEEQLEEITKKKKWDESLKWVLLKFKKEKDEETFKAAHPTGDTLAA